MHAPPGVLVGVLASGEGVGVGEAIGLYRAAGYRETVAFNDERYAHHWFEKSIAACARPSSIT